MVRWLKGLLDSTRPHDQTHPADETIAEAREFARFLAIHALGVHRQTTQETLRNFESRCRPLGPLRTEIVQSWRVAPHQTKNYALRRNLGGFIWRTVCRERFAITHSRSMMAELSMFGNFPVTEVAWIHFRESERS
jgi:hypothetical protein